MYIAAHYKSECETRELEQLINIELEIHEFVITNDWCREKKTSYDYSNMIDKMMCTAHSISSVVVQNSLDKQCTIYGRTQML